jgi:hypothetical protein
MGPCVRPTSNALQHGGVEPTDAKRLVSLHARRLSGLLLRHLAGLLETRLALSPATRPMRTSPPRNDPGPVSRGLGLGGAYSE